MGADNDVQAIKKELATDNRDVADLWTDALRKYKGIVGEDLMPKFTSVDAMIVFGTQEMNSFHQFRHNQKKVDKLRSLFAANLDYIAKGAQQLIAAAAPAFPPAAAIGTALTYMLSACKAVSADYDVVTAFFEDMNAFLQRITILESRLPKYPAYRNCLMDVFTSVLEMCGFATKYIELGRFKKWILNMVRGEDGDLGGARKKMDTSLSRLQSATEYAILGNTEELQRMNSDLQQNQDLQTKMMEDQTKMLETVMNSQESVRSDLQNIQKLLITFEERRREDNPKQRLAAKASGQNKKPPTSVQVRSFFEETLNPAHEYHSIKESFIADTCTWIFEEPLWVDWLAQEPGKDAPRVLALLGPPGSGKSHLAASAYDRLVNLAEKDLSTNTCVVHFYFRETTEDLSDLYKALNWAVIQIAEQNAIVCEKICAELQRDDLEIDQWDWKDVWTKLVKPCFGTSAKARLHMVWDGLDELSEFDYKPLAELFTLIKGDTDLNITVFCTTRSVLEKSLRDSGAHIIEVTKEKQLPDLKALIWHHLNNDSGLRKFSKYVKQTVSSTLEEKADGMLYAEHLLRQYGILGREPLVLKALQEHLPEGLEGLYLNMVADLQHHTPDDELHAMKTLLWWLAYSNHPLTLAECLSILEVTGETSFDLERELQGRQLARFLRMGDLEERITDTAAEDVKLSIQSSNKSDKSFNDGDLPLKFQERSMRGFFRGGSEGLRTIAKDSHREIFILCSEILCGRHPKAIEGLRQYAAGNWMWHLSWNSIQANTEHDRIRILNALGSLMSNETNAATVIEALGVDYKEINADFGAGDVMRHMKYDANLAVALKGRLNATTETWAASVAADVGTAFEPLARGHITNWFQAEEAKPALRSFKFAQSALNMKKTVDATTADDSDSDSSDSTDENDEQTHFTVQQIIAVFNAFADIPKGANAYRVAAILLENSGHHSSALNYGLRALELCKVSTLRFQILNLLAIIYLRKKENGTAYETICEAFSSNQSVSPSFRRRGLITRAKAEAAIGRKDEAIATYEAARLADPDEPLEGFNLKLAFNACLEKRDDALLVDMVRNWKPMERLAWMTWDFNGDGAEAHEALRRAAYQSDQLEYLYQAYDEVIKLLDNVDSAPPIRFQLAVTHWVVGLDMETAKALLNETLDSSSSGYPFALTDEDPAYTLVCAVLGMTDIIYEQYRATSDVAAKAKLYNEMKSLTEKPLALSVASLKSELMHYSLTMARMARKMAPAEEFQTALEAVFNLCYDGLTDSVGWNDYLNLNKLAAVVSGLGLEKEAHILISAQFSKLDPSLDDSGSESESNDEEEKDDGVKKDDAVGSEDEHQDTDGEEDDDNDDEEDGDDYPLPDDEGDLTDDWAECSGECYPTKKWRAWKGRSLYVCVSCSNTCLCEDCYHKRQGYNQNGGDKACRDSVGSLYCGTNHKYIKGPMPGWKGIKDGIMTIEGQNGEETIHVKFRDWLDELKDVKWKEAWERFWLNED